MEAVSADYRTKHFTGYHHEDGVAIFTADGEHALGYFTPELVRELQSITDQWRASKRETGTSEQHGRQQQQDARDGNDRGERLRSR